MTNQSEGPAVEKAIEPGWAKCLAVPSWLPGLYWLMFDNGAMSEQPARRDNGAWYYGKDREHADPVMFCKAVAPAAPAKPDPRLADALANPPGPRHARLVEQASSGETAGDGVTHEGARSILHHWAGARTASVLLRYIDQQETSEREAANQLRELQHMYAAFEGSGHSPKNPREAAQAIGQMADGEREAVELRKELGRCWT